MGAKPLGAQSLLRCLVCLCLVTCISSTVFANGVIDEYTERVLASLEAKRFEEALMWNERNKQANPLDPEYIRREGVIYYLWAKELDKQGDTSGTSWWLYQRAINAYADAIELAREWRIPVSKIVSLITEKSIIHWEIKDYYGMANEARTALRIAPDDVVANYQLGRAIIWSAFTVNPQNPPRDLMDEGTNYLRNAIYYSEVNQDNTSIPYAYFFVGVDEYRKGNYERAKEYLKRWISYVYYSLRTRSNTITNNDVTWVQLSINLLESIR